MIVLVANLGSTSFKYKLFDIGRREAVLAHGAADRIGQAASTWTFTAGEHNHSGAAGLPDHAAAIDLHLRELRRAGVIKDIADVQAVGFKAVHGGPISGAVRVNEQVLDTMQQFADVTPQHNPPYIAAMRAFSERLPHAPQVAAFETAFHQGIPLRRQAYAIPYEWTENLGIRRYGFHGASHQFIAARMAEVAPAARRIISCHLGGSSSVCAIENGQSVANSFGMTTQSGLPHAARVGDFDAFCLLKLLAAGLSLETIWKKLGKESGLLGASGVSPDCRDVEEAAARGNARAQLALDILVEAVRHYIGAYLAVLNGADAIVFTGGIGQNATKLRAQMLAKLTFAGIVLDVEKNAALRTEGRVDAPGGKVQVWVLPTNEELIVARQTVRVLAENG